MTVFEQCLVPEHESAPQGCVMMHPINGSLQTVRVETSPAELEIGEALHPTQREFGHASHGVGLLQWRHRHPGSARHAERLIGHRQPRLNSSVR